MKAKNYLSFYGLLSQTPYYWDFNKKISVTEFLENNPEFDLDEFDLERLYSAESFSLSKVLERFTEEVELIRFFRELFDEYRSSGGDPLQWLYFTFEKISLNPHLFKGEHRGIIEGCLIQWIENFTKQPFDLMALNIKALNERDLGISSNNIKHSAPVFALFCSIVHQSGFLEMEDYESKEQYCQRVSTYFNVIANSKRARQYFTPIMDIKEKDKYLKKVIELILPEIPIVAKGKIETFLNSKVKLYG